MSVQELEPIRVFFLLCNLFSTVAISPPVLGTKRRELWSIDLQAALPNPFAGLTCRIDLPVILPRQRCSPCRETHRQTTARRHTHLHTRVLTKLSVFCTVYNIIALLNVRAVTSQSLDPANVLRECDSLSKRQTSDANITFHGMCKDRWNSSVRFSHHHSSTKLHGSLLYISIINTFSLPLPIPTVFARSTQLNPGRYILH